MYQEQTDGTDRVIAYASRTLSKSESKYHSHKLEFLALKWAVTDRFHEYLYGGKFEVFTDNNPLTYILTTAKLDATGQRWVASLANYDFKLNYRSGKENVEADALSRIPWKQDSRDVVKATLQRGLCGDSVIPTVDPLSTDAPIAMGNVVVNTEPKLSVSDWKTEQSKDPDIHPVVELVRQNRHHTYVAKESDPSGMRVLLKYRKDLVLKDGLLYRKVQLRNHDTVVFQFVLPASYQKRTVLACHNDMGHLGMEKTLGVLQDRFFWPKMGLDVRKHIRSCDRCTRFKQPQEQAKMLVIETTYPLELLHMDFLTIGRPEDTRTVNVLVLTDHFTRYSQAYITPNQTAPVVAKTLWENFLVHYGWPTKILTDQGKSFENALLYELCKFAGVQKLRTTPYRPQGNGQCERFNHTLIRMLGTLPTHAKKQWSEWVSVLTHAYNCTVNKSTNFTPYFLMYGRRPRLPIDIEYGVTLPDLTAHSRHNYAQKLKARLDWAYRVARQNMERESLRQKRYYDQRYKCMSIEEGDLVLVRVKAFGGDHKIADKWEQLPYRVISQMNDTPVYKVQQIDSVGDDNIRILHRNMLYPLHTIHKPDNVSPGTD